MIETRIPIAPDTSTTLTDETTEHIIHRKQLAKVAEKYPYTPKKQLVKKQGHAHVKKQGGLYY